MILRIHHPSGSSRRSGNTPLPVVEPLESRLHLSGVCPQPMAAAEVNAEHVVTAARGLSQDAVVHFPDPSLRDEVRAALHLPDDVPITRRRLLRLTELSIDNVGAYHGFVQSIQGLQYARNLRSLGIAFHGVSDLSPLAGLTRLRGLYLTHNRISDLRPLRNLSNLRELLLDRNRIRDLRPLEGLHKLKYLTLGTNQITNIDPLARNAGLGAGDEVDLGENYLRLEPGSPAWHVIQTLNSRKVLLGQLDQAVRPRLAVSLQSGGSAIPLERGAVVGFGTIALGSRRRQSLRIANQGQSGADELRLFKPIDDVGPFRLVRPLINTVKQGSFGSIVVELVGSQRGSFSERLRIPTNDPGASDFFLILKGVVK